MMKRIMSLALALLMLVSVFPATVFASDEPEVIVTPSGGETAVPTGETEPTLCEICNADPCVCEDEDGEEEPAPTLCETCGADPCVCEDEDGEEEPAPTLCEICNADPCVCEDEGGEDEPAAPVCNCEAAEGEAHAATCPCYTCPECGAGEWHELCPESEPAPTLCESCNADPCVCDTAPAPDYSGDVGRYVSLNSAIVEYSVEDGAGNIQTYYSKDFTADTILHIKAWKVNDSGLWYQAEFYRGSVVESEDTLNFPLTPWFMQNNGEGANALVFLTPCAECGKPDCGGHADPTATLCETCGEDPCVCEEEGGEEESGSLIEIPACPDQPTCWGTFNGLPLNNHQDGSCTRKEFVKSYLLENTAETIAPVWNSFTAEEQTDIMAMVEAYTTYADDLKALVGWGVTEPENPCGCCEECTGDEECDCQCGECDFCVKLVEDSVYASVNGQTVSASGMLPEGAKLVAYEAISGLDGGFAYDIKILDADGNEWQPANGEKVSLSIPVSGVGDGTTIQIVHALENADAIRQAAAAGRVLSEAWAISAFPAAAAAYADVFGGSGVAVEILTPTVYGGVATVGVSGFSIYQWNGSSFQQTNTGDTLDIVFHKTEVISGIGQSYCRNSKDHVYYVTSGQNIHCDRGGTWVGDREWQTSPDGTNWYYNTDHIRASKTAGKAMDSSGSGADVTFTVDSDAPAGTTFWIRCRIKRWGSWEHWADVKVIVVDTWSVNFYNGSSKIKTDTLVTGSGTLHDPIEWPSDPSKSGYTFRGWSTANTGTSVINKSTWYPTQSSTNLYAVFTYDVTYNLNGGSGTSTTQTVNSNDSVILHADPTKTGYSFGGWRSSADGVTYDGGGTYSAKKNTTMTAQWNANNYTYNVKYVSSTGEALGETTVTHPYGDTYTVTPPAITGYTTPQAQSVAWDSTSAKTITFTYTLSTYKISYNLDGGSVATANPTSYNVNTASFTLRNPVKAGYTFAGWTGTGITGVNAGVTIGKGSTGDRSYTATYTPNIYHVTLDKNGGDGGTNEYWYKYKTTVEHGQPNTDDGGLAYYYTDANCINYMINGTGGDRYFHVNIPTRYGYTFEGYYLGDVQYVDKNGTCVNNIYDNVAADSTLVAKWTAITDAWYTVYYKWQEGEGENYKEGSILDNKHVSDLDYGTVVTETALTLAGYTLVSESTYNMVAGYTGDPGTEHTFYYTRNEYPINFDYNGGHQDTEDQHGSDNPTTATLTMTYGSDYYTSVGVLYPHREGHTFLGWYTEKTGGEKVFNEDHEHVNGTYWQNDKWSCADNDLTLYAHWQANTYTVKFHGNGSTAGSMAEQVFVYDEEKALTAEGFTRSYEVSFTKYDGTKITVTVEAEFLGWATSQNGEVVYTNGQTVKNLTDVDGAAINLYAVWKPVSVTLPEADTRVGYTFDGWLKDGTIYQPGEEFAPIANAEFTGKWTAIEYTATFVYGDGQANGTQKFTADVALALPVPTKTGYTYVWKVTEAAGNWAVDDTYTGASVPAGKYGDVTFTLVWTPKTDAWYTVHYYYEGTTNELAPSKTVTNRTYGTEYTEEALSLTGYTLISATQQKVTASYEDNEIIFYYKPISYTITYNLDGGALDEDESNPEAYTVESETFTLHNPTKEGYIFAGWTGTNLDEATLTVNILKGSTGDRVYTATWTAIPYTITYNLDYGALPTGVTNPEKYTIETESFTLNNPTKAGYEFLGWTGTGFNDATKDVTVAKGSTGDRSYTAMWMPIKYEIKWYNDDEKQYLIDTTYVEYGTMPSYGTPTKPDTDEFSYTFIGWSPELTEVTGDAEYVAQYQAIRRKYTVTFVDYDGKVLLAAKEYEYGTPAADIVKPANPQKTADVQYTYTFAGWNPEIDDVKGTVTYKATYTAKVNQYTLRGEIENGTVTGPVTVDYNEKAEIYFVPNDGYIITSWSENGGKEVQYPSPSTGASHSRYMTSDRVIVCYTKAIDYTISYDLAGGKVADGVATETNYTVEQAITLLESPTKEGWTFVGWKLAEGVGSWNAGTYTAAQAIDVGNFGDVTFVAQWERSLVDLTIVTNSTDANQSFIFTVSGTRSDEVEFKSIEVVLVGNDSITIKDMPVGDYTVIEKNGWSWRQNNGVSKTANLREESETVTFSFGVDRPYWLSGCSYYGRRKGGNG